MPCLLMSRPCKVCGKHHDFFFSEGELVVDRRYEYQCPQTGQTGYLWDFTRVEAVSAPPPGGVELHPTEELSGRHGVST